MSLVLAVNDVVMVRLNYFHGTDVAFNVLHYQVANITGAMPNTNTVLRQIAEDGYGKFADNWATGASNQVSMSGASAQSISPAPRSRLVTYTPSAPLDGEIVSEAIPLQDSPTIVKTTEAGERWGLGRLFWVGVPESMQENGSVIAGFTRSAITGMATALVDPLDAVGTGWTVTLNPVLFHAATPERPGKPATAERITRITGSFVADWVLKSQKSRRPGKGI